uniref:Uncharacterized protein n=1 Tax=Rhizophora mucronata TaxID=61149 RepID=A0A2P2JF31_RHIMU
MRYFLVTHLFEKKSPLNIEQIPVEEEDGRCS